MSDPFSMSDPLMQFRYDYGMVPKDSVSLRDQFAMSALPALIVAFPNVAVATIAESAYQFADAMLAAREKRK